MKYLVLEGPKGCWGLVNKRSGKNNETIVQGSWEREIDSKMPLRDRRFQNIFKKEEVQRQIIGEPWSHKAAWDYARRCEVMLLTRIGL